MIPAPNGAGLIFEDGTPFVPVGDHLGISWGYYRNLYPAPVWDPVNQQYVNYAAQPGDEGAAGPHFSALAAKGVNTLRVFLELLNMDQTGNPGAMPAGRYWIEFPSGNYNDALGALVLNALEQAAANGMYLIFSPFDTFTWDEAFTLETPWYSGNGGPLASIDDFFQNGETLEKCKNRLRRVMDWVASSPHKDHLLGWEPLNEWDSYEWTLNAEGNSEPGRETEMRRRAIWIRDLNQYVREQDPDHLVISSSVQYDPRGPVHRQLFYDHSADVLAIHFYTNSTEEPINNPAADKSVLAGIETRAAHRLLDHAPSRQPAHPEWRVGNEPVRMAQFPSGLPNRLHPGAGRGAVSNRVVEWIRRRTGRTRYPCRGRRAGFPPQRSDRRDARRTAHDVASRFELRASDLPRGFRTERLCWATSPSRAQPARPFWAGAVATEIAVSPT